MNIVAYANILRNTVVAIPGTCDMTEMDITFSDSFLFFSAYIKRFDLYSNLF